MLYRVYPKLQPLQFANYIHTSQFRFLFLNCSALVQMFENKYLNCNHLFKFKVYSCRVLRTVVYVVVQQDTREQSNSHDIKASEHLNEQVPLH